MTALLAKLADATRAKDWRHTLMPFVLGCAYLWLLGLGIGPSGGSAVLLVLSLAVTIGFAAFGYLLNEWTDIQDDLRAGKANRLAPLPIGLRLTLLAGALALCLLPWLTLPSDSASWALIAAELGAFAAYSLPPLRLKRVFAIANLLDAAYAYVLPMALSFHTYALFADAANPVWVYPLLGAAAAIGLRGIVLHQVDDVLHDSRTGLRTLPRAMGPRATAIMVAVLLVAEMVLFIAFLMLLVKEMRMAAVLPVAFVLSTGYGLRRAGGLPKLRFLPIAPVRHVTDQFYQILFPLLMLALLTYQHIGWGVILPIHLLLLTPAHRLRQWQQWARDATDRLWHRHVRRVLAASVNYPIYYAFLVFGVNLREEGTSALGYLSARRAAADGDAA